MFHLLLVIIYLAFISLGLPDGLLGAAWPTMYPELGVGLSYAGGISIIIALGTVVASLLGDRLTYYLGTGKVTAISVGLTALALLGFSVSRSYWMLCLWAIPYGLGAGSVDASLNNYVALHYTSRHMSWLHCMWGIGAAVGPYIMGHVLSGQGHWSQGYRYIGLMQVALAAILFMSLSMWKKRPQGENGAADKPVPIRQVVQIPGAREVMIAFFCYCAIEQTTGLWASSYLVLYKGIDPETGAFFASLFYIGITLGRAVNGFLTVKLSDTTLVRGGLGIIGLGIGAMLIPLGAGISLAGLILIGLGCAPIYPCIIHSTPEHFGADKSQALIGVQMASAYVGTCVTPPLFGLLASRISTALLPVYLLAFAGMLTVMHEKMLRIVEKNGVNHARQE